jgi:hypothetical protein
MLEKMIGTMHGHWHDWANRSRAIGADTASHCASTNPFDGNPARAELVECSKADILILQRHNRQAA